jgi:hypothetical protein
LFHTLSGGCMSNPHWYFLPCCPIISRVPNSVSRP